MTLIQLIDRNQEERQAEENRVTERDGECEGEDARPDRCRVPKRGKY